MNKETQVKEILQQVKFVSMATVNEDGSPHNSPLLFLYDQRFEYIYWGSTIEALHSKNIVRTGEAFFAVFNSLSPSVGLYVKATECQIAEGTDLDLALTVHNHFRANVGKDALDVAYYCGTSPQRMWRGKVAQMWINAYERGADGRLIKDYKIEVTPGTLGEVWE